MKRKINFKYSDDHLKRVLKHVLPYDLAVFYPTLNEEKKKRLVNILDIKKLADMFNELNQHDQLDVLDDLSKTRKKDLFKSLEIDELKAFIEELDEEQQETIIAELPAVKAKTIRLLLTYDEDLAASIMTTDFITVSMHETIKEVTNKLVTQSKDHDYIDTIFVVDNDKKLIGVVDLKQLIIARGSDHLEDIMMDPDHSVYEDDPIEKAIQTVRDYDRNVIPVLDRNDHVIGIVTADDIYDEIIESSEFDYQKMALLQGHMSDSTALKRSSQRLPWLMIAVVLNLLIASFLSMFEATLAEVAAIVLFQPLILGMAGNIGTQALAVTILGLHLEEIDNKQMPKKYVLKEVIVGLFNSLALGLSSFVVVFAFLILIPIGQQSAFAMGMVVFLAVFASMFISAIMGVLIPLTLDRLDIDPATASGPIITTINDLVALLIYFGIATLAFML